MRNSIPLVLASSVSALGCLGFFQSYAAGIQVICDAPEACTECADAAPEMKMMFLAKHIESQLWNADAIALFGALASAAPDQKIAILRHEAHENGVDRCLLADLMESEHRQMWSDGVAQLCALSTDCGLFDPSDPASLAGCLDALPYDVADAARALDTSSSQRLAEGVQKLAAQHGQPACALSAALRNAP